MTQRLDDAIARILRQDRLPRRVARALAGRGRDVALAFNRKEAKEHGEGGVLIGAPLAGRVLIVDDVITAGTAIRESLALIRAAGVQRYDFSCMLESQSAFAPYARGRDLIHVIDMAEGYEAYEAQRKAAGSGVLKDCDKKRRRAEREVGEVRFTAVSRSTPPYCSTS